MMLITRPKWAPKEKVEAISSGGTGSARRVLSWRLPITIEADFCVEAFREAITRHGQPDIFNADQGVQFASAGFLEELESRGS